VIVFALRSCTDIASPIDDRETEADVAAQQQFVDDITPDLGGEVAAADGPDDTDDIGTRRPRRSCIAVAASSRPATARIRCAAPTEISICCITRYARRRTCRTTAS
jgi:hypothetical protein